MADIFASYYLTHVHLVKMDIEGAEAMVIPAIKPYLKEGLIGAMLIELHVGPILGFGSSVRELVSDLVDCGFQMYSHGAKGRLVPVDMEALADDGSHVRLLGVHRKHAEVGLAGRRL